MITQLCIDGRVCHNGNRRLPITDYRLLQSNFRFPIYDCYLVPITVTRLWQTNGSFPIFVTSVTLKFRMNYTDLKI